MQAWVAVVLLAVTGGILAGTGEAQCQVLPDDDFKKEEWRYWCPCQIDTVKAKVQYKVETDPAAGNITYARIPVDDHSLGGNRCLADPPQNECDPPASLKAFFAADALPEAAPQPDLPERLTPSFFAAPQPLTVLLAEPKTAAEVPSDPYCKDDIELRAHRRHEDDECIQRQELRLYRFKPESGTAFDYSFRFRMPKADELGDRKNSIRWVVAQWKEEPVAKRYTMANGIDWGPSPFLAVRFDDGVLNVTVQDEECQCLVASAPHPSKVEGWLEDGKGGWIPPLEDGPAKLCQSTRIGDRPLTACYARFSLVFNGSPVLESPLGKWTTMRFRVQAKLGANPPAEIDVRQDGRLVVTVKGDIGYEHFVPEPCVSGCNQGERLKTVTKFKIGHYRDYMPFPATMDVDWLKVEEVH